MGKGRPEVGDGETEKGQQVVRSQPQPMRSMAEAVGARSRIVQRGESQPEVRIALVEVLVEVLLGEVVVESLSAGPGPEEGRADDEEDWLVSVEDDVVDVVDWEESELDETIELVAAGAGLDDDGCADCSEVVAAAGWAVGVGSSTW